MLVLLAQSAFAGGTGITGTSQVIAPIPRPEVAIIISKQRVDQTLDLELKQSFLPKVAETAKQKPF